MIEILLFVLIVMNCFIIFLLLKKNPEIKTKTFDIRSPLPGSDGRMLEWSPPEDETTLTAKKIQNNLIK